MEFNLIELIVMACSVITGFIVLSLSSDRLVLSSSTLAYKSGMSVFMVGATIVAFGTSAPELVVSSVAAYNNSLGIAVGNVIGSNIFNIGLVLGLAGIISPIAIKSKQIRQDLPILLLITCITIYLLWDKTLKQIDGGIFLILLFVYLFSLIKSKNKSDIDNTEISNELSTIRASVETIAMIVVLILSSQLLVWGASGIARYFGVDELVIGLTIVAFGTSLPELTTAIASAKRGAHDLLLGTIIGSNLFNMLAVLGVPAMLVSDGQLSQSLHRDLIAMGLITVLFYIMCATTSKNANGIRNINPLKMAFILISFLAYYSLISFELLTNAA